MHVFLNFLGRVPRSNLTSVVRNMLSAEFIVFKVHFVIMVNMVPGRNGRV